MPPTAAARDRMADSQVPTINDRQSMPIHRYSKTEFLLPVALLLQVTVAHADPVKPIPAGQPGYQARVTPFFQSYCVKCHGASNPKAGLSLAALDGDFSAESLEQWELVSEMLASGEMPPAGEDAPDGDERRAIVHWIEAVIRERVAEMTVAARPTARRLTNFEYENTIRDLLGIELDLAQFLPEDPARPYRFNNTAEYMLMGVEQIELYEANARRAITAAIVDSGDPEVYRAKREWGPQSRSKANNELAISGNRRGAPHEGLKITQWPKHGEYRIRIKASAILPEGISEMPLRLVMGYGLAGDIGNAPFKPVGTIRLADATPQVYEFRGRIENHPSEGERQYRRGGTRTGNLVTLPANMVITPQNLYDDGTLGDGVDPTTKPRAAIDFIEFEAPVTDAWPPAHHQRILFPSPLRESDPEAYVAAVLQRFLPRAFRRPVAAAEVQRYVQVYKIYAAELPTLEEAMRETLAVALTSPNFLYHVSRLDESPKGVGQENESAALHHHYRVASRLSYFLWGSMPDEQLFELAAAAKLNDRDVIEQEVRRMLADDRSADFVRHFSMQWLSLDKARSIPINLDLFPRFLNVVKRGERAGTEVPFVPTIRDDMVDESVAFIAELIARNASVLNIVDADFAMLNQRLAVHYGIEGVQGHELRPVAIEREDHLGGLLTQGAILIGNSTGSAPHPIYRAVWLREAILGDEVKDPPADVPALEDSAGQSAEKAVTIKDLLRQHRQKESCNDCHARLDPWGIPFERYNAIGKFQPRVPKKAVRVRGFDKKTHQDLAGYQAYLDELYTVVVEAQAQLPGGPQVDGMRGLKEHLLKNRRDDIAENVIRRLLSYGLGRELTYRDRPEIAKLQESARQNDYRLQDMIVSICQADVFLGIDQP